MDTKPRLLDQVRNRVRAKHYSHRTEQAYVAWTRRFVIFNDRRHPDRLGGREIENFLTYLAVKRRVSASAQNQALAALLFLYQEVLGQKIPWLNGNHSRAPPPASAGGPDPRGSA